MKTISGIRNIIFDFGDIFINLDKPATLEGLKKFGFDHPTPEMQDLAQHYEKGLISTAYFEENLGRLIPKASPEQIRGAWNAILKDIPQRRLAFLKELKAQKKYRLFLLSNTNELHIQWVQQDMGGMAYQDFKHQFDHFYLSYQMGKRKPDAEIYQQVLDEQSLLPEETLFIDDSEDNTIAAARLGIRTWHLQVGKEDIVDLPKRL
jgi:putative hydrolase of the HAD superfamily